MNWFGRYIRCGDTDLVMNLSLHMTPILIDCSGTDGLFHQDNDTCHIVKNVPHWLKEHDLYFLVLL